MTTFKAIFSPISASETLKKRGQAIRECVREVGFHGATALVAIGVE
ncbi:MAG: hypothetical protein ISR59_09095 [Anaerolineales bacterium]|uniref:Uncharacterized protein n=1 Tax=Candidatus Desulfolinea nitratireducens TaxID=2841698 RepID=A0A8J6TGZ7_9CHLR|nr:hypothetical protein [Candidatus Desulfolinea nitratireducens]MBL6961255.1 hypothetical protein [Anaerolineales bacterium]